MQRVLLIDDDPDIRGVVADVLSAEGYEVETATDGLDALRRLDVDPIPTVIVLDLMMAGMNGWEFRARQLESERLAGIPVVLLSASPQPAARGGAGTMLGVSEVLCKPLSLNALLDALRRAAPL